jgi:hypothetical protein
VSKILSSKINNIYILFYFYFYFFSELDSFSLKKEVFQRLGYNNVYLKIQTNTIKETIVLESDINGIFNIDKIDIDLTKPIILIGEKSNIKNGNKNILNI